MKKLSSKIIVPVAGLALVGAGLYGVSQVSAATTNKPSSLVQEIADAFHLDKTKVQAVADKHKGEERQFHEAKFVDRLSRSVTDGKLTSAQKDAIVAERAKLEGEFKMALAKTSDVDRKAALQQIRQEGLDWAEQNNIKAKWLRVGRHGQAVGVHNTAAVNNLQD